MPKYIVRIDACFNVELEADSAEEAQSIAEDKLSMDDLDHITETLVFNEDGATIADD